MKIFDTPSSLLFSFSAKHPVWWEIIRFCITALPLAVFALLSYSFEEPRPGWHEAVKHWFQSHSYILLLVAVLPPIFALAFDLGIKRGVTMDRSRDIGSANVVTVLSAINQFVGQKLQRFGECARRIRSSTPKPTKAEIFEEITQPDYQIQQIVTQLYFVVRKLTNDDTIKVVLVELGSDDGPRENSYACYLPGDRTPSLDLIGSKWNQSFFNLVASGDHPRLIANIHQHLHSKRQQKQKKFFPASSENTDEGSIIGFPVLNPFLQRNTHVLTFRSDIPDVLSEDFKRTHRKYLEFFFTRIHLEYNLKFIKNAAA